MGAEYFLYFLQFWAIAIGIPGAALFVFADALFANQVITDNPCILATCH
jgi:hypothetical protein